MVKLSEVIKTAETTLPVCGVKVVIHDCLSFDDEVTLRGITDVEERGLESLRRVLVKWDLVLDDGVTQAPADDNTLNQLPASDVKHLLIFINETVARPRTPAEEAQAEKDAKSLDELTDEVIKKNLGNAENAVDDDTNVAIPEPDLEEVG